MSWFGPHHSCAGSLVHRTDAQFPACKTVDGTPLQVGKRWPAELL
jgi:hypothetical protein